ncbi:MAG TPA: SDR family NAD(P)-dependent oxidoreductase [Gemmatimonadales bacterium]|nr:SDR family NAD(P)-dependent oxidoreductase [Gemmatimonadales bacterium]
MISLSGKRVIVTGGSRGIGRATALLFARAGADVALTCRSRRAEADQVAEQIRALGRKAWVGEGDLGDPALVDSVFAGAVAALGGLDCFIGNAGVWPPEETAVRDMAVDRWQATMRANLDSVFLTTRAALRHLGRPGRIVLVGSTAGQRGESFHADYAATKGAMISFVKSLCIECAPGITVNCVAPGWVDTEMSWPAFGDGGRERIARTIPLGRIASAEDVAGPILFLCSELAAHVTGEILNVNGGSVLCG